MQELLVRFVAAEQAITSVLVGVCQPVEIEQNVASWLCDKLSADEHAAMETPRRGSSRATQRLAAEVLPSPLLR